MGYIELILKVSKLLCLEKFAKAKIFGMPPNINHKFVYIEPSSGR